jgi:3-dehydrotetronate 4-kinase
MLLGCIADDFTGASDLANTLVKNGMSTVQFVGVPRGKTSAPCEAAVVALKTRSIPSQEAVRLSLEALRWLQDQGCEQFFFKYCSTFDSTPEGNIGPVAEALIDALQASAAVVCPVFPETGRTLYQGHLFVKDRPLNESGMEHHPLNPMTDSDIRRWLRLQTKGDVGLIPYQVVSSGAQAIVAALANEDRAGRRLVVVDAVSNDDLRAIGRAVAGSKLVTGGSGLAIGLPDNFREAGKLGRANDNFSGLTGPGVVFSGSCSSATREQLAAHLSRHPGFLLNPGDVLAGDTTVEGARAFVRENVDAAPIVYSTASPAAVEQAQEKFGREKVATALEDFFGALAAKLVEDGFTRIVVGGGETSGAVINALHLDHLLIGPEIDPGVPALATSTRRGQPIRLALKSGNFGALDFYDKALKLLEAV